MGKKLFCITTFLFITCLNLSGQDLDTSSVKHIGVGFGMNITKTDLSERFEKPTGNFQLYLKFANKSRFNSAIYLSVGQAVSENRDVKFLDQSDFKINSFAQANIQSIYFEGILKIIKLYNFELSLSQGFGLMRYNVYDENDNLLIDIINSRQQGESYSGFSILLPTSLSINYQFKNTMGLQARIGLQNTITDYLDNISAFGNSNNNDNILSFQLSCYKVVAF